MDACLLLLLGRLGTPPSRPNKVGLKCPPARPYVRPPKSFFDFNEILYVGRGRRVTHDSMQYDPIQGQGHEHLKVGNSATFKGYLPIYNAGWQMTTDALIRAQYLKLITAEFSIFVLVFCVT